jgi:hypothetical protein
MRVDPVTLGLLAAAGIAFIFQAVGPGLFFAFFGGLGLWSDWEMRHDKRS